MTIWYYAKNNKPVGPISEEELSNLLASGQIDEETLVWHDGLADWQPIGKIKVMPVQTVIPEIVDPMDSHYCAECGNLFSKQDMISFQDKWICGRCKHIFIQKLKEGISLPGEMKYAGFGIRFVAKMIDGMILFLLYSIVSALGETIPTETPDSMIISIMIMLLGLQVIVDAAYATWFVGKFGATPGKLACGLKIVFADGRKVGYGLALGRHFAEWISTMILGIGYLMAAVDGQKRTLHDRICGTRVIRK